MPDLRLNGCRSRPLIGYLKSLGVLRTLARQGHPDTRARWRSGTFELRSGLSQKELVEFFAREYQPSPILSPWNGGSGFYVKGNTAAVDALQAIEHSADARLARYRELIADTRSLLAELDIREKPEGELKEALLRLLRRRWPDDALEWLDAAVVLTPSEARFPPLLGSGGNDGRYDMSKNFLEAIARLAGDGAAALARGALVGGLPATLERANAAYLQRDFSPTNSPAGDALSLGNPWDLILALEGSLLLVGGVARHHSEGLGRLTAPFTAHSTGTGYGSAVTGEDGHAELWLPLWSGWATVGELEHLIREGRAQVRRGGTARAARNGLEFARAAGELGVARGVAAFERYAILNRSGQDRLAVPAGRISVRPSPAAEALRALDTSLESLRRLAARDGPRSIERAVRQLERAVFGLATRGRQTEAEAVLQALGAAEHAVARSGAALSLGARPARGVDARPWLELCDDGSPEFAVAASLGSLRDRRGRRRSPALRDYLHGTKDGGTEFDHDRRHLVSGSSPAQILSGVHARRHLDAERSDVGSFSLGFARGVPVALSTARAFSVGALDEARVLVLARAICLLDHEGARWRPGDHVTPHSEPSPAYDVLALSWVGATEEGCGARPGWAARLAAGKAEAVLEGALLDLRRARLVPVVSTAGLLLAPIDAPRLGAALLLPLEKSGIGHLRRRYTVNDDRSSQEAIR